MVNATSFQEDLRAEATALGFAACGFASAATDPLNGERLEQWLGEDRHGSMEWMEARKEQRASPQGLWPDARSVIALGMSYAPDGDPLALDGDPDAARISVYAQGRDYHDVVKKALKALARWMIAREPESELKVFGDTAPVPTRHEIVERLLPYVEREVAGGVPLKSIIRHILGLFNGRRGARAWRRTRWRGTAARCWAAGGWGY